MAGGKGMGERQQEMELESNGVGNLHRGSDKKKMGILFLVFTLSLFELL